MGKEPKSLNLNHEHTECSKQMKGLHCYDLLANNHYAAKFSYISADKPNRYEYIIDDDDDDFNNQYQSDMVRAVLGLAYLKNG